MLNFCNILSYTYQTFDRRYNQDSSRSYENEKCYDNHLANNSQKGSGVICDAGGWDSGQVNDMGINHAIPVQLFPKHVVDLHMNQVIIIICYI